MYSFSPKQKKSLVESNARINIWEGAVRSGKTYITIWRFLREIQERKEHCAKEGLPVGEFAIITRTYDSFKRNIFQTLCQIIGGDPKHYSGKREVELWGQRIHIIGADDERAESKIRGATFAGAYVDELTIIPESVFKMLISRCSMGGARIFATTNPDSPFHWVKRDYLTDNSDVKSWQFTLDDNPDLGKDAKDYLKRQYKGVWYQRFIEGKWVQAQGAIYDFFDPRLHVIDFAPGNAEYYLAGCDYGTVNPCAFVLVGVNRSKYPNMWVEDLYYYDSRVMQRQKTDSEYAEDFLRFTKDRHVAATYIDPSAASFKLELQKSGVTTLYDAENEVLDGIRLVSNLLNNGTLKICRKCDALIKEIQSYVWDPKCAKLGEDKPLKVSDHACVVGSTLVRTQNGNKRIDELNNGELINLNLSSGLFEVDQFINASLTRRQEQVYELELLDGTILCATGDHLILTIHGYKMLQNLTQSDMVIKWSINTLTNGNST